MLLVGLVVLVGIVEVGVCWDFYFYYFVVVVWIVSVDLVVVVVVGWVFLYFLLCVLVEWFGWCLCVVE